MLPGSTSRKTPGEHTMVDGAGILEVHPRQLVKKPPRDVEWLNE